MHLRSFPQTSVFQMGYELFAGGRRLRRSGPCVTVFGSARSAPGSEAYALAQELGYLLAEQGFTVLTGGGPGVMEAASKGAKAAGGRTVGCNIRLVPAQAPNAYLDHLLTFEHFFLRKSMLISYSAGFVALPGGLGTLDELFEAAVLMQKGKIERTPIVLLGARFWAPLFDAVRASCLAEGTVSEADLDIFRVIDTAEEALALLTGAAATELKVLGAARR